MTIRVEIRTDDTTIGTPGRDGRTVVEATEVFRTRVKATGCEMVTFRMARVPSDWPDSCGVAPAEWVLA